MKQVPDHIINGIQQSRRETGKLQMCRPNLLAETSVFGADIQLLMEPLPLVLAYHQQGSPALMSSQTLPRISKLKYYAF